MSSSTRKSVFQFFSKSDIVKIATIAVLVFVITNFLKVSVLISGSKDTAMFDVLHKALSLPGSFALWLKQPWSLITYMFSSEDFISLLFDMIWLWVFGSVIEDLKGPYRILPIYMIGGIFGGLAFMLTGFNHPNQIYFYLGVMPSLIAVVTATVTYNPQYAYWFYSVRIPIWVLAIFFFVMKIGTLQYYSLSSMALIIGGAIAGVIYTYGGTFLFDALTQVFKRIAVAGSNDRFVKKTNPGKSATGMKGNRHQDLDAILDKINQKGMNSLTAAERKILESYSNE